jgi:D-alanyl-D-alanine carboxypeptidase/D-alanyl-D-alanine-endopeptidase (penicillin-binding protein 4)
MIQRFRQLALSAVLLPLALSCHAAGAALPTKVEQALKANKTTRCQ